LELLHPARAGVSNTLSRGYSRVNKSSLAQKISWSRGGWYQCPNLPSGWGANSTPVLKTPLPKVFASLSLPKESSSSGCSTTTPGTSSLTLVLAGTSKPGMSPSAAISQGNCRSFNAIKSFSNSTISSKGGYAGNPAARLVRNGSTKFIKLDKILRRSQPTASEKQKKFEQTAKIQEIQVTDSKMMQVVREESLEAQLQPDFTANRTRHF